MSNKLIIALSTAPDLKSAKVIAKKLVSDKLAACVNIIPAINSVYIWKNKLHDEKELLLLIKSEKHRLKEIESTLLKIHPYDTPEFLVLKTAHVEKEYLKWALTNINVQKNDGSQYHDHRRSRRR